jgi:hypothetical protein
MENPIQCRDYFKAIKDNWINTNLPINDFRFGDSDRIIAAARSELSYPCLWLETPDYSLRETGSDDNLVWNIDLNFLILVACSKDDYESQDTALNNSFLTIQQIILKLRQDGYFSKDDVIMIEPINTLFADACTGFRVSFTLKRFESTFTV